MYKSWDARVFKYYTVGIYYFDPVSVLYALKRKQ